MSFDIYLLNVIYTPSCALSKYKCKTQRTYRVVCINHPFKKNYLTCLGFPPAHIHIPSSDPADYPTVVNRPGVAGAVLQSSLSLINYVFN